MKKIKLTIIIFLSVFLIGCDSANKNIENAFNKFKDYDNYTTDYSVNVASTDGLQATAMTLLGDSKVDRKSKIIYDEIELSSGNNKLKTTIYIDGIGNIATTKYTKIDSETEWSKETSNKVSLDSNIINYLDSKKKYIEVESDLDDTLAYETTFTINELSHILNAAFGNPDIKYKTANATYRVYLNDDSIVQILFRLTAEYDTNMISYVIKSKYSKFNTTETITIPKEILENAINKQ